MKLISAHIENFGKFHNEDFDFTDGLNSFLHENGWGKTTLSVFIKSMLYGLDQSTKKNLDENEKQKYFPWQGGVYGGNLVFEHDGKKYRVSRTFGRKKSDDTFELLDLQTNKKFSELNESLGERIYGVSRETYERSVHVTLEKNPAGSSEISAKLTNLIENDDVGNFDKAYKRLDEKATEIKAKRKSNDLLTRIQNQIDFDRDRLDDIKSRIFQNKQYEKSIVELKAKESELQKKQASLSDQLAVSAKFEGKKLTSEEKADYERLANLFYGVEITEEKINGYISDISNVQSAKVEIANRESEKSKKQSEIEMQKLQNQKAKNPLKPILLVLAVLFLILGLVGIAVLKNLVIGFAGLPLAIVSFVISLVLKTPQVDLTEQENEIKNLESQIEKLKSETTQKESGYKNFIHSIFPDASVDTTTLSKINVDYNRFITLKKKQDNFLEWSSSQTAAPEKSVDDLNRELDSVNRELTSVTSEKSRCENEFEKNLAVTEKKEDFESEIENLTTLKREKESEYAILEKAKDLLAIAKEKLDANYSDPMKEGFEKYIKMLGGKIPLTIDTDLKVSVDSGTQIYESEYLSEGYKDMVNFCSRMALIDALFPAEKPAIILDDPFVNLDDEKIPLALDLVKKMSEEKQILYFACHQSRMG